MTDRSQWRAGHVEQALEPELEIVDTHHHLWDVPPFDFLEPYGIEAALRDKTGSGHNVTATVLVDSHSNYHAGGPDHLRPVGETQFADHAADEANRRGGRAAGLCAAIVAHADLTMGAKAGEVLDAHLAASARLRGIRHNMVRDPDVPGAVAPPGAMLSPAYLDGVAEVGRRGLSFDTFFYQDQAEEVIGIADRFPDIAVIINHLASPKGIGRYATDREAGFAVWRQGLARLAERPNTVMKLSGLNMAYTGLSAVDDPEPPSSALLARRHARHMLTAIDLFGPSRCMFASNFPVDMLNVSYVALWNGFKLMTTGFTPAERAALFSGTARRVYRIA